MANEIQTKKELAFLSDLQSIVATARRKGYEAVNQIIVICNWLIGRRIVEQEQQGKQRAEYGKRVIKMASEFLTEEFGKGFSVTNLKNFRSFYLTFSNLLDGSINPAGAPVELIKAKRSDMSDQFIAFEKGQTRLSNLTWSHFECLLRVKDEDARRWYLCEAEQARWSVRTLDRNISSQYYYRLLQTPKDCQQEVIDEMQQKTADFQRDKLDMYIRMYDELECTNEDNPTIGLLLCAETSKDLARYSILRDNNQLFAAKYMTYLPKKEELIEEIERQKQIFALQQGKLIDNNETR